MGVHEDVTLANSTDVTNLLVYEFNVSMETTSGDALWINDNNERHDRIIHNMVIAGLIYGNQHENKWFCAAETSA